jgi:hypothetical protein
MYVYEADEGKESAAGYVQMYFIFFATPKPTATTRQMTPMIPKNHARLSVS